MKPWPTCHVSGVGTPCLIITTLQLLVLVMDHDRDPYNLRPGFDDCAPNTQPRAQIGEGMNKLRKGQGELLESRNLRGMLRIMG